MWRLTRSKSLWRSPRTAGICLLFSGFFVISSAGCAYSLPPKTTQIYMHRSYIFNEGVGTQVSQPLKPFYKWMEDPNEQFRIPSAPKKIAKRVIGLTDLNKFSRRLDSTFAMTRLGRKMNVKVVAPAEVVAEVREALASPEGNNSHDVFELCNDCDVEPDILVVPLCEFGRTPCFSSFAYIQYGESGMQTGQKAGEVHIIRGPLQTLETIQYFCPSGFYVSVGTNPADYSHVRWFEFSLTLSVQLLGGLPIFEVSRDDVVWSEKSSVLEDMSGSKNGRLTSNTKKVELVSLFEGQSLGCKSKLTPAVPERFMTLAAPVGANADFPRVCIVSGHEATPKAQANMIARCARFSASPTSELYEALENQ